MEQNFCLIRVGQKLISSIRILDWIMKSVRLLLFCHIFFPLLHRIRRTQSGSLPADGSDSDFKRGGFRATAGPRLACLGIGSSARYLKHIQWDLFWDICKHLHSCFSYSAFVFCSDMNAPFSKWSCDQVCAWMEDSGMGQYVNMARQWVTSGQTLLSASSQDIEKVRDTSYRISAHVWNTLGIKNICRPVVSGVNNLISSCNTWWFPVKWFGYASRLRSLWCHSNSGLVLPARAALTSVPHQ